VREEAELIFAAVSLGYMEHHQVLVGKEDQSGQSIRLWVFPDTLPRVKWTGERAQGRLAVMMLDFGDNSGYQNASLLVS